MENESLGDGVSGGAGYRPQGVRIDSGLRAVEGGLC